MVKMINFATVGAFYVKMSFAFFVIYKLINKASAVTFDGAMNKAVFNKLCHKSISSALAYFVIAHLTDDFFNCECFITV